MTLLVITPDYASHAMPLLAIAARWRDAGERVVVATGPAMEPRVIAAGIDFELLVLGRGSNDGVADANRQPAGEDDNLRAFFAATRRGMVETVRYQARARANDLLWRPVTSAEETLRLVDRVRPDAILVDHLAFGATLGLRAGGIEYADVVLGHPRQLPLGDEVYGVPGAWPGAITVDEDELQLVRDEARLVAGRFTSAYNDALMAVAANADPVGDAFAAHGSTIVFNYPEALHPPSRTAMLPQRRTFLGGIVRREQADPDVQDWLDLEIDAPIISVSLGTFLSARDDVLAVLVAGLRRLDARVALATGSTDPVLLDRLPREWLVQRYLPQVALLGRSSLHVSHAGNNSVVEALAAGVPMYALPFSTDQFDGAAAVESAGFGVADDPNTLTPERVTRRVTELLEMPTGSLRSLAASLRAHPGAQLAYEHIAGSSAVTSAG